MGLSHPRRSGYRKFVIAALVLGALADLFGGPFKLLVDLLLFAIVAFSVLAFPMLVVCFAIALLGSGARR